MDPNPKEDSTPAAHLAVPEPTVDSKVFDLSSVNNLNQKDHSFFKKKPFIIGIVSVFLLVVVGGGLLYFTQIATKQGPGPQPKAASCPSKDSDVTVETLSVSVGRGNKAYLTGRITNHCGNSITVKLQRFWSAEIERADGGTSSNPKPVEKIDIAPGATKDITIEQLVGDTGLCGSAQVDLDFDTSSEIHINGLGAAAYLDACEPPPGPIKCDALHLTPNVSTITPGQVIRLKVDRSGGTGSWQTTEWTITTNPASGNKGTQSGLTGNSVNWTAPATLTAAQSWTFTGTVKDSSGATNTNANCTKTVSYSTTTTTYTHNVCNADKACVSVPCNPATTACATSSDCTTSADCETTTYKFNTCENNSCVSKDCPNPNVSCAQDDDCTNDNDCKSTPTHKVCRNEACVTIDGAGTDNCTNDSACQSNPTHKTCVNNACVTVNGAGSDSCTSDAMCQPEATPPPIPESGNTLLTIGTIAIGAVAILGGIFLAL